VADDTSDYYHGSHRIHKKELSAIDEYVGHDSDLGLRSAMDLSLRVSLSVADVTSTDDTIDQDSTTEEVAYVLNAEVRQKAHAQLIANGERPSVIDIDFLALQMFEQYSKDQKVSLAFILFPAILCYNYPATKSNSLLRSRSP